MGGTAVGAGEVPSDASFLVTVVIPVWGLACDALPCAVASAEHPRARVVVVDNANDDPVSANCDVLRLPERVSVGQARNAALEDVSTPYVLFLDADDVLLPGAIDYLLEASSTPAGRPVLVSSRLLEPVSGNEYHWPKPWQRRMSSHHLVFALLETVRAAFPVQGSLLPTDAVRACGGYAEDEDAAEDWVLGVSLAWSCDVRPADVLTMRYAPAPGGRWSQAARLRNQLTHRRCVRNRIREDPQTRAVRWLLPLLATAQLLGALREWAGTAARRV